MEMRMHNPLKGRLEKIDAVFTDENTTWFDSCNDDQDIYMITDFEGGILISKFGYGYPVWIYDVSRAEVGYDQRMAKEIKKLYE